VRGVSAPASPAEDQPGSRPPAESSGETDAVSIRAAGARDSLILRGLSGGALAGLTIAAVHLGGAVFAGLIAFLVVVMVYEWTRMVEGRELTGVFYVLAGAGALAIIAAALGWYEAAYLVCALGGFAALGLAPQRRAWTALTAPYILAPAVALVWLRTDVPDGRGLAFLLFAIVWSADSAAYLAGRAIGGPRLSPLLSPAKTWAGAGAGLVAGAAAGLIGAGWIYGGGDEIAYAFMGGALGVASIVGDIVESAFKRRFGVKDISGFVPGHGGFLDRLDGMIFATVAMTAVLYGHLLLARL